MSASAMVIQNSRIPDRKSIFVVNLLLKLFPATVANTDIRSLKSFHSLFDKYLDHMLVKFEQSCMILNCAKFWAFWQKKQKQKQKQKQKTFFFKPFLTQRWHPFGSRFCSWSNCLLLHYWLLSFSVPKITVVRHV